eukprot:1143205-Rhodomonas_salina.1
MSMRSSLLQPLSAAQKPAQACAAWKVPKSRDESCLVKLSPTRSLITMVRNVYTSSTVETQPELTISDSAGSRVVVTT